MAITYYQTTDDASSWNAAGSSSGSGSYKDITLTVASGDLLVVIGIHENYQDTFTTRSIATQTGTTSSWTVTNTTPTTDNDVETHMGWATVTSGTSVTIRVSLRGSISGAYMGIGVWRIPSAEWTGTPAFTVVSGADATGKTNVSVANSTSMVFWGAGDYSAVDVTTTTLTGSGGTLDTDLVYTNQYAVAAAHWTGQASGSRDYGWNTDPGAVDMAHLVCVVQEATALNPEPVAHNQVVLIG